MVKNVFGVFIRSDHSLPGNVIPDQVITEERTETNIIVDHASGLALKSCSLGKTFGVLNVLCQLFN